MKKNPTLLLSFILILLGSLAYYILLQSRPSVLVTKSVLGSIRDSVSGNVKVHAAATFELRAEASAKVDWVALLPLGETLNVEKNQTLIELVQDDLIRRKDRILLDKKQFFERKDAGSVTELLLEMKENDLSSSQELAAIKKISAYELYTKQNEVKRLRTQVKLEKLAHQHFLENFELSKENLDAEIEKRIIRSPIDGDFSACYVAPGNQVFSGTIVGKVHSRDRIIEVTLNEEDFFGLKSGLGAGVTFFSTGNKVFDANVSAVSSTVDASSGTRQLFLSLAPGYSPLPVGSAGRAEIIKSVKNEVLLLPRKALVGDFVVVDKNGVAEFRKVIIGAKNLQTVEIIDGLKIGEKVVVEMPHLLKNGERIKSLLVGFSM